MGERGCPMTQAMRRFGRRLQPTADVTHPHCGSPNHPGTCQPLSRSQHPSPAALVTFPACSHHRQPPNESSRREQRTISPAGRPAAVPAAPGGRRQRRRQWQAGQRLPGLPGLFLRGSGSRALSSSRRCRRPAVTSSVSRWWRGKGDCFLGCSFGMLWHRCVGWAAVLPP